MLSPATRLSGWRLALLVAALTAFCAATGLWEKTMATLYLCGVSTIIAGVVGIAIGIAASRSNRLEAFITPILDTLQTLLPSASSFPWSCCSASAT